MAIDSSIANAIQNVSNVVTKTSSIASNIFKYEYLENKNVNNWKNLDDELYNNHFGNGQCQLKVEFVRNISDTIIRDLPIYPEEISFGGTTNYASAEIIGRPGPIAGYINTSDVTTRISLHLHRELQVEGNVASDKNKIDDIVNLIQACAYPKVYQDGLCVPIVTYTFGDTIITGKQTSWNTKWSGPKIGNSYMYVTIDVAISHVPIEIPFFDTIRQWNPRQFK